MRRFGCDSKAALLLATLLLTTPTAAAEPVADPTDLDLDGVPGVRPPPSPEVAHPAYSFLTGTGSLLIERSHQGTFDVSGFTSFLESQGWVVDEQTVYPITAEALAPYDILMVPARVPGFDLGIWPFTAEEQSAIQNYVAGGRGLWVFHEAPNENATGVNSLSSLFGVVFYADFLRDSTNNEGVLNWPTIHLLQPSAITSSVSSFGYYFGTCLSGSAPAVVVATGDDDTYSYYVPGCTGYPPVLAAYEAGGRAVFCGDNTPLYPGYYPGALREEEQQLLQNIASWLLGPPPNANAQTSWGQIKAEFRR